MEPTFEVDLDAECVWLDDAWMSRDELKRKITGMLEAGDYRVARPSQALESLTKALTSARLLALRISPELSDALNAAAQQTGRPVGALARDALAAFLQGAASVPATVASAPAAPEPVAAEPVAAEPVVASEPAAAAPRIPPIPSIPAFPAGAPAVPAIPPLPVAPAAVAAAVAVAAPSEEPVSPEEAASAVTLTPKHKEGEEDVVEQGWFGK